jgi:signal transduction histidine kinase
LMRRENFMPSDILDILVIDDDRGDRAFCRRTLKSAFGDRLRYAEADSGENGLEAIDAHIPDCVLLDHVMPGIDGLEVLRRMRIKHPFVPTIIINGNDNDVMAVKSMQEGAQDYIAKSTITPAQFQRIIPMAIQQCVLQKRTQDQRVSLEIFTRALAHDLKEPVRTMRSFLDRITDWRNLSEKSQKSFHYVSRAADRMNALIDAVYLYTRLDGADEMERISCGIADVLDEVRENLTRLIEERRATLTYGALPRVHANRVQMIQLFQNLIGNAIRHCARPVTIRVDFEDDKDGWRLAVRDDGSGIGVDDLAKIFDPFKRLSQRKGDEPGFGLGLAINRKIVESYGGKIWCESTPGEGACFMFTLPKETAGAGEVRPVVSPDAPAGRARAPARVLLVDDNECDIELNRFMLTEEGGLHCDVLTACDGREALAAMQRAAGEHKPIDLVLLDINMPVMSGFELLAHLSKEERQQYPLIVMCSTSSSDIDKRMAASFGVTGYMTKPARFSKLKTIIEKSEILRLSHDDGDYILLRAA